MPFRDLVYPIPGCVVTVPEQEGAVTIVPDAELLAAWRGVLRGLVPRNAITEQINALLARLRPERTLGVHLRRTDVLGARHQRITRENVARYDASLWLRITEFVASGEYSHVYLAADDRKYFLEWREKLLALPIEVVFHEHAWGNGRRQTPLAGVVVAKCRLVLASVSSSLLLLAQARGGQYELVEPLGG